MLANHWLAHQDTTDVGRIGNSLITNMESGTGMAPRLILESWTRSVRLGLLFFFLCPMTLPWRRNRRQLNRKVYKQYLFSALHSLPSCYGTSIQDDRRTLQRVRTRSAKEDCCKQVTRLRTMVLVLLLLLTVNPAITFRIACR